MNYTEQAQATIQKLFHCAPPSHIPIRIDKKGLRFWEKGALWVEGEKGEIQLKEEDAEVLAHEWVHAMRIHMNEPRFEEIFAYMTSKRKWRAIWGPLIRKPQDAWIFLSLSTLSILQPICVLFPLIWLALQSMRLFYDRHILFRAARKKPWKDLVMMKDADIMQLGKGCARKK